MGAVAGQRDARVGLRNRQPSSSLRLLLQGVVLLVAAQGGHVNGEVAGRGQGGRGPGPAVGRPGWPCPDRGPPGAGAGSQVDGEVAGRSWRNSLDRIGGGGGRLGPGSLRERRARRAPRRFPEVPDIHCYRLGDEYVRAVIV